MRTNLNYLILLFLFFPLLIFGQNSLSGSVVDEVSSSGIAGVNILVKGTTNGTASDLDGTFKISVNSGDVLVFSYLGYLTKEVTYSGQTALTVVMSEDSSVLDEIVVIGYGSIKKDDLTGAADLITSEDFNQGAMLSPEQLITGKLAGVSITSGGGIVLGFSAVAATIPAGEGVLTTISFDVSSFDTEICFSDAIIAGATGDPLNFITGSCIDGNEVSTCDDATACNFGELGDCLYADFVCWDDSLVCDESDCPEEPEEEPPPPQLASINPSGVRRNGSLFDSLMSSTLLSGEVTCKIVIASNLLLEGSTSLRR